MRLKVTTLLAVMALAWSCANPAWAQAPGENEPNSIARAGSTRYVASDFPDRIVASPLQDASRGFSVMWRTNLKANDAVLEIVEAGDSPDVGTPRRVTSTSSELESENGKALHHKVLVDGLKPGTLYMFRVQGNGTWSAWNQLRTLDAPGKPLTLLYFGDTQNKNVSHVSRVSRQAMRQAGDATLALFAGDLVSGGHELDDTEWGEWFEAMGPLPVTMLVAPAIGNHEYFEKFEKTPQQRRVLGRHWNATFALPSNGAKDEHTATTTYWFDAQGVRFVMLDGTSALDLGSMQAQAAWLDGVLAANPQRWSIVMLHQPIYSPRGREPSEELRKALQPVIDKHHVDLVLQGHDHTYGRRGGEVATRRIPQYIVSVAGPKQYRLGAEAKRTMKPVGEDTQFYQVLKIDAKRLEYRAYTATGRLYDAFEILRDAKGIKSLREINAGRIPERDCSHRDGTLGGRKDRCWE